MAKGKNFDSKYATRAFEEHHEKTSTILKISIIIAEITTVILLLHGFLSFFPGIDQSDQICR